MLNLCLRNYCHAHVFFLCFRKKDILFVKKKSSFTKSAEFIPFMDISRKDKVPVTFEYDPRDESQTNGLCYQIGEKTYQYKGYRQLLDEILDYEASAAVVPSYIKLDGPNDLLKLLNK